MTRAVELVPGRVLVDGSGPVAAEVAATLRRTRPERVALGRFEAEAGLWSDAAAPLLVVLVRDRPVAWSETLPWQHRGVPHLPVTAAGTHAVIGPLVVPGRSGCVGCDLRWRHTHRGGTGETFLGHLVPWPADTALAVLAAAVTGFVAGDLLKGGLDLAGVSTAIELDPPSLRHRYTPAHPHCCGRVTGTDPDPAGTRVRMAG